jgi:predicted transcriptional regulator
MATTTAPLHPAMQRYLTTLAAKLRRMPAAAREEALADAREFLQSEWDALSPGERSAADDAVYQHFARKFGSPAELAAAYGGLSEAEGEQGSTAPRGALLGALRLIVVAATLSAVVTTGIWWTTGRGWMPGGARSNHGIKEVWAGRVVSFEPGTPEARLSVDPTAALGPPDCSGHDQDVSTYVSLGHGGTLIVEFTDGWLCDGEGPDLKIIEIGPLAESFEVAVSASGKDWISVGRALGAESLIDLAPFVNPTDRFRFVRLIDAKSQQVAKNRWPGADIDAVGALHSVPDRQFSAR